MAFYTCSRCGTTIDRPTATSGVLGRCPKCNALLEVGGETCRTRDSTIILGFLVIAAVVYFLAAGGYPRHFFRDEHALARQYLNLVAERRLDEAYEMLPVVSRGPRDKFEERLHNFEHIDVDPQTYSTRLNGNWGGGRSTCSAQVKTRGGQLVLLNVRCVKQNSTWRLDAIWPSVPDKPHVRSDRR